MRRRRAGRRPPATAAGEPLLATRDTGSSSVLFFADPISLQPLGLAPLPLDFHWGSYARSPAGSLLALSLNDRAELRFVRLDTLQPAGAMPLSGTGYVQLVAWPSEHMLIALLDSQVLAIDPSTRTVLWRRTIAGSVPQVARSPGGVVLLVTPLDKIGPAKIAAIGTDGSMRTVVLNRVLGGSHRAPSSSDYRANVRTPALTIDPAGNRAFVVGAGEPVAEVDLGSMQVRYHGGSQSVRAPAKAISGPWRTGTWLGNGTLAVSGTNSSVRTDSLGRVQQTVTPSGLILIDTRTWETRVLQQDATATRLVGDALLAYGRSYDSAANSPAGAGLTVYNLDGTARLHLFGQTPISWIQTQSGLAYVWLSDSNGHVAVIDPASGRTLADVTTPEWTVLLTPN